MRPPVIRARIERRLLVNYRVRPKALGAVLPPPFRPVIVQGHAIAGLCLIRLGAVRPAGVPEAVGITTENAAHRIAVEWDTVRGPVTGVYIARRDTASRLTALVGGRAFPGRHHRARFRVEEGGGAYRVAMASLDGEVALTVAAHRSDVVMPDSVFPTLGEASDFFCRAPVGYNAARRVGVFEGVALATDGWAFESLQLDEVRSSFFDDLGGSPDSAFLMAGIDTSWRPQSRLIGAER